MRKNTKIPEGLKKGVSFEIPIDSLVLDNENPRLSSKLKGATEFDIIKILYEEYEAEEIAYSMAENGYFDEEPIVVIPKNNKNYISLSDEELKEKIKKDIYDGKKFFVVEGNRRIAAVKMLLNGELRKQLKVKDFPHVKSNLVETDLRTIPALVYTNREDVMRYLGVRHIIGVLKWDAFEKALYISNQIEKGVKENKNTNLVIADIQQSIGDRSDVIKKQFMCYKIASQAEEDMDYDIKDVKKRFSLIYLALNYSSIRDFIGVPSYKEINYNYKIVPTRKLKNLIYLLSWIYGNGPDEPKIIDDSRKIQHELKEILSNKEATEYLIKYRNLEQAYERSEGEKNFLLRNLNDAKVNLQNVLRIAFKFKKDKDVIYETNECYLTIKEILKTVE